MFDRPQTIIVPPDIYKEIPRIMQADMIRVKTRDEQGKEKTFDIPVETAVAQLRRKRRRGYAALVRRGMGKMKAFETVLGQY